MVYVENMLGQPLMPTENHRKVRILLKENKAVVVNRDPFTIRLTVRTKSFVQTFGPSAGDYEFSSHDLKPVTSKRCFVSAIKNDSKQNGNRIFCFNEFRRLLKMIVRYGNTNLRK